MNALLVLTIISLLIFFSILGEYLFRKFNIPDVLVLIFLGILLGPTAVGLVHLDLNSLIIAVFSAIAISIVMLDGGVDLDIKEVIKNTPLGIKISLLNFIILLVLFIGASYLFKFLGFNILDLKTAILLASILGGTSGIVVVPLLDKIDINEKIKNILIIESTFTDALTIVITLSLLLYYTTQGNSLLDILKNVASSFSISIVLGILFALIWSSWLDKLLYLKEVKNYRYLLILAVIFLLYVIASFLGGSSAIAVFIFALILGNIQNIKEAFNLEIKNRIISKDVHLLNTQFSFLIKTFFFFLIGVFISLEVKVLLISLILLVLIILARFLTALVLFRKEDWKTKLFISFFTPKGLAASVLALYVAQFLNNNLIVKIVFDIILFSIILAALSAIFYSKFNKTQVTLESLDKIENKVENKEVNLQGSSQ